MADQPNPIEQKLIEFATKSAETIQNQAGQIQALSHVLMIALVSMSEQHPEFKRDFIKRVVLVREQLSERPVDRFTREYCEELVRFLENPYQYSKAAEKDGKPNWLKGIITGGRQPDDKQPGAPPGQD